MKYITDILVDRMSKTDQARISKEYDEFVKSDVLSYLKKFEASSFTTAPVIDVFTGLKVSAADNGYTDGEFTWYESEVYYFEHYNLKLNKDFLEHVKSTRNDF